MSIGVHQREPVDATTTILVCVVTP
jgi:hypothetical protein